jgi:hypothetical protein
LGCNAIALVVVVVVVAAAVTNKYKDKVQAFYVNIHNSDQKRLEQISVLEIAFRKFMQVAGVEHFG